MRSEIDRLLIEMARSPVCELFPPTGQPQTGALGLPEDVKSFFERCGGALIFGESEYPTRILAPGETIPTDDLMWDGEPAPDESSSTWFLVADDGSGNYVSIDLAPDRLGWCYDTQLGRYGSPGDCPVIARSLAEFLRRTLDREGERYFWLVRGFVPYGDAYDGR